MPKIKNRVVFTDADEELGDEKLEEKYAPAFTNADNYCLGCDCWVDEVNGPGAAEVPEFVPTRHELFQLLKYWHEVSEGNNYVFFRTGMMRADSETRLDFFAESRMSRIGRRGRPLCRRKAHPSKTVVRAA